jgi:hypothetical protein
MGRSLQIQYAEDFPTDLDSWLLEASADGKGCPDTENKLSERESKFFISKRINALTEASCKGRILLASN